MSKVSALKELMALLAPLHRKRLEAVLEEEPNFEQFLTKDSLNDILQSGTTPGKRSDTMGWEFTNPSPLAMMEPERFRSLALPIHEDDFSGRAAEIARDIEEQGGINDLPILGLDSSPTIPKVVWHDGRGRSAALESLGIKKAPVVMSVVQPLSKGLDTIEDKIRWLRQSGNLLLPEQAWKEEFRAPVDIGGVKIFADGGKVVNKEKPSKNILRLLAQVAALPNPVLMPGALARDKQLFARGLLSQWYGLNSEGDPEFLGGSEWDKWPGLVDEVISMPTLLPDKYVPAASARAASRLEKLNARMHEDMGIAPAQGLHENIMDAAGTMAGQVPMGGAKAVEGAAVKAPGMLRKASKAVANMGEWFTPTVEATPGSYLTGTLVGGGLNTAAEDDTQGVNIVSRYANGGGVSADLTRMKGRYAGGGGTDSALKAINNAISAIESGDRPSAVSLLRPHKGNSAVAEVLKSLEAEG